MTEYAVVCASAWCNESGFGVHYNWDRMRFPTREAAIDHGFTLGRSDDFNIAVLEGNKLVSFDWMDEAIGEPEHVLREIAREMWLPDD